MSSPPEMVTAGPADVAGPDPVLSSKALPEQSLRDASQAAAPPSPLLICLPSLSSEALHATLDLIARSFAGQPIFVASPDYSAEDSPTGDGTLRILPYATPRADLGWVLAARDYVTAAQLATERNAAGVLLLGADASSLSADALRQAAHLIRSGVDLALPHYDVPANEGLVTSALIYPMTRALFAVAARFPLALDAGLSTRMAQRMATVGQRFTNLGQSDALLWPAAEAASAGFNITEFAPGTRSLPQPDSSDFNALFTNVAGSLFADVENRAIVWQRARTPVGSPASSVGSSTAAAADSTPSDISGLVQGYRLAFRNLQEVWSLVVPPQSLLALKKLSLATPEEFSFPPGLWARVAYDFALAFHARILNRGHLLGAFTPLYLAWVASALRAADAGADYAPAGDRTNRARL